MTGDATRHGTGDGRLDLTVQRLVDAWMSIPGLLILLTVMSVVGRGVLQIIVELGVLGREGREYMEIAPRLAVWPGLCLTVVVYCLNMVGDAVRDLLDPRLRGGSGRLGAYGAQAVAKADSTARPARK